jgi:ectoine hydroxylase-related dioxygenase (phytanoyl-CoA dioxygenase family)
MTIAQALAELGVRGDLLLPAEQSQLDEQGFVVLEGILAADQLEAIRARMAELHQQEGDRAGLEVHQEAGTDRLADLVNKDRVFEVCFTHPRVLAAVAHVLQGDLKLSSLNSRAALPGQGHQGLHSDGNVRDPERAYYDSCQTTWLLDDLTEENGPTRVVPGTHRSDKRPEEVLADRSAPHPEEVRWLAPAGTVIVSNAHLWHSGTTNRSAAPRRVLHAYFCRRAYVQQTDQRAFLRPETAARIGEAARCILDV